MIVTRRFGSPSGGSGPISLRRGRHDLGGLLQVGGMGLAAHILAWELVALAAASFPSHSSESHVSSCLAKGSAGLAVAGRRPSCPSRIRVQRVATRGAAGRRARCAAAAGAAPGHCVRSARPARAGILISRDSVKFIFPSDLYTLLVLHRLVHFYAPCQVGT